MPFIQLEGRRHLPALFPNKGNEKYMHALKPFQQHVITCLIQYLLSKFVDFSPNLCLRK